MEDERDREIKKLKKEIDVWKAFAAYFREIGNEDELYAQVEKVVREYNEEYPEEEIGSLLPSGKIVIRTGVNK